MSDGYAVLNRGQLFRVTSGGLGAVADLLGAGGQGAVYSVDLAGRRLALKWYHPEVASSDLTLRQRISALIARRPPDDNFLWPMAMAEIDGLPSFGYIMPLVSPDRRPLTGLFAGKPKGFDLPLALRATACLDIAERFQKLHAEGYCYQDVNFGGFFIDPQRGTVQICDGDNITVEGQVGGVYGTRKFMAPEIVRREAMPSTATDLYSMSVLFFYLIFNWHPLDGRRESEARIVDAALETKLYGTEPKFLFDPQDVSNGPVPGAHDWVVARWAAITERLRALYTRAFTLGLSRVGSRPVESEWRSAFAHLRDSAFACQSCTFEHGVDKARLAARACVTCRRQLALPPALAIRVDPIFLPPDREVYEHQFGSAYLETGSPAIGRVERHPRDPTILGLRNLAAGLWTALTPDGQSITVPSQKTVRILDGATINFGAHQGVICGAADWVEINKERAT